MPDTHCVRCGALLGTIDHLRGSSECAACRGVEQDLAHGLATTPIAVMGLSHSASVAQFKRCLSQLAGVKSVGVKDCSAGVYEFTVRHDPSLQLPGMIAEMTEFHTTITRGAAPYWSAGQAMTVMVSEKLR